MEKKILPMKRVELKAKKYLASLGIKKTLAGYIYLLDVILYQLEHPFAVLKISMVEIADRYDITYRNLQNSIQYCIKIADGNCEHMSCRTIVTECIDYIRNEED